jgi:hypothetical protein
MERQIRLIAILVVAHAAAHSPPTRAAGPAALIRDGKAYLATTQGVQVADVGADGRFSAFRSVATLPDAAAHAVRAIAFGADGMLEIGGDARNSYAWDPATGELWCRSRRLAAVRAESAPAAGGVSRAVLAGWPKDR